MNVAPADGMKPIRRWNPPIEGPGKGDDMRRFVVVLRVAMVGILAAGLTSAFAGTGIVQEETVVFGEHTLRGRNLDLVGEADDFRPGDRYIFRSELTDAQDAVAGHLFVDRSVHFAKKDSCSQVYEIPARGTVMAEGLIPVSQLKVGGPGCSRSRGAPASSRTSGGPPGSRSWTTRATANTPCICCRRGAPRRELGVAQAGWSRLPCCSAWNSRQ